ncbi:hypothetical protein WV31_13055 [Magnetospirillum sp. ME-1]|uniref:hypothetical protein n=1 Tax=Magnetospirillum sp. ME-1 TaxID=1639348 RepID=UPI000A17E757|nr:hypothetical protein [Magnetospirillum sp. ME-1]ARJ66530.1 hypothetical protein WV31_13055 [Magnetospirillum sp. ME-1]
MTVLLARSGDAPGVHGWDHWAAIGDAPSGLDPSRRLDGLAGRLEAAFDAVAAHWWALARELATVASARWSFAATCSPSSSDLGAMMAWALLAEDLAAGPERVLLICDDPWLFRLLAARPGIEAMAPPPLASITLGLKLRGLAARLKVTAKVARAALSCRSHRRNHPPGHPALLVYGHPQSNAQGHDAYFGPLMSQFPGLLRALHTDCPAARATELAGDGRSASLHAWGGLSFALTLVLRRWRPTAAQGAGRWGWLVRRAAAIEGSGGAAAMAAWQEHCQNRWLDRVRPQAIAWPWENHPWERLLVRRARALGLGTVGYQHTVVGRHRFSQSPDAAADGERALPDIIACNGPAYRDNLLALGVPAQRLAIAGALRFPAGGGPAFDPRAPVLVALPSVRRTALEILDALAALPVDFRRVLIKHHPMYKVPVPAAPHLQETETPFPRQPALSAVISAESAVGLEAALAGIPFVRFLSSRMPAMDILPPGIEHHAADAAGLEAALKGAAPPGNCPPVFSEVDMEFWRSHLGGRDA